MSSTAEAKRDLYRELCKKSKPSKQDVKLMFSLAKDDAIQLPGGGRHKLIKRGKLIAQSYDLDVIIRVAKEHGMNLVEVK